MNRAISTLVVRIILLFFFYGARHRVLLSLLSSGDEWLRARKVLAKIID